MELNAKSDNNLRHRAPLIYWIAWAYGTTNLFIGAGVWQTSFKALSIYPFVRGVFSPHFYGAVFFLMGFFGIISLLTSKWQWTRRIMMFGLMVKSLFFYGLVLHLNWELLSITAIWLLIMLTQFLTVVYFPKLRQENGNVSS